MRLTKSQVDEDRQTFFDARVGNTLEMPSSIDRAVARETIISAQVGHISGSTSAKQKKTGRIWGGACFAIVLLGLLVSLLSHRSIEFFVSPGAVPDGGTTVMLLGAALSTLGVARRFFLMS